jgi:cell shape-determining protein MreC
MISLSNQSIKALTAGLALALGGWISALANDELPQFVTEGLYSPNAAPVKTVLTGDRSDLVVLDGGLHQGIRSGMICRIQRGTTTVGEIIIVASNRHHAAGLILQLASETTIQSGDIARIKTILNS